MAQDLKSSYVGSRQFMKNQRHPPREGCALASKRSESDFITCSYPSNSITKGVYGMYGEPRRIVRLSAPSVPRRGYPDHPAPRWCYPDRIPCCGRAVPTGMYCKRAQIVLCADMEGRKLAISLISTWTHCHLLL